MSKIGFVEWSNQAQKLWIMWIKLCITAFSTLSIVDRGKWGNSFCRHQRVPVVKVRLSTCAAPPERSTLEASAIVLPVVKTSSTRITVLP